MSLVVAERVFSEPVEADDLTAQADRSERCFVRHRVQKLGSYLSFDRRHLVTVFEAPDAEAVRVSEAESGLPSPVVWPATLLTGDPIFTNPKGETIVVQRRWSEPLTDERVQKFTEASAECGKRLRATLQTSFLSPDGLKQVCIFAALDSESVRQLNDEVGTSYDHIWRASPAANP